jgi:hypothetical protein
MKLAIFNEITTSEYLDQLTEESEKYTGLYVDMEDPKQRKYVKDKAATIKDLLKKVDRTRIDSAKNFKLKVEAEAAEVKKRLEDANLPFTLLIDEYAEERKKILDAEKAEREAIELACKIEADHEFALLMNDKFDSDKLKAEQERKEYEQKLKDEAIKAQAEQAERDRIAAAEREAKAKQALIDAEKKAERERAEAELKRLADIKTAKQAEIKRQAEKEQAEIDAESARLANIEHVRGVNLAILESMIECGLPVEQSKEFIKLVARKQLTQLTINY